MKTKVFLLQIVFSVFLISAVHAQIGSPDELLKALAFADDPKSINRAYDFAINNPDMVRAALLLENPRSFYQHIGKKNAFRAYKKSSYRGIISEAQFFEIAFKLIANITLYHNPGGAQDALSVYRGGLIYYRSKVDYSPENLEASFESILTAIQQMESQFIITNSGLRKSLESKIRNAKKAIEKLGGKGRKQAINKVEAAIKEATAQSDKHLTADGASVFIGYCENLIKRIQETVY